MVQLSVFIARVLVCGENRVDMCKLWIVGCQFQVLKSTRGKMTVSFWQAEWRSMSPGFSICFFLGQRAEVVQRPSSAYQVWQRTMASPARPRVPPRQPAQERSSSGDGAEESAGYSSGDTPEGNAYSPSGSEASSAGAKGKAPAKVQTTRTR